MKNKIPVKKNMGLHSSMDHSEAGAESGDGPFAIVGTTEGQSEPQCMEEDHGRPPSLRPWQPLLDDDTAGAQRGETASDHFQP